jgi:hypothetical protein
LGDNGASLLDAVRTVEAFGNEVQALKDELEGMLLGAGAEAGVSFEGEGGAPDDGAYNDTSGWVSTGWRWTFPARERRAGPGRRRAAGALSIVVDIGWAGGPAEALGLPCLLVAWSDRLDDWEPVFDAGEGARDKLSAESFWPRNGEEEELRAGRLFWWLRSLSDGEGAAAAEKRRAKAPKATPWFYALPLMAVTSPAKLRSLVVAPVLLLLEGRSAGEAFVAAPEVLRFRWENGRSVSMPA